MTSARRPDRTPRARSQPRGVGALAGGVLPGRLRIVKLLFLGAVVLLVVQLVNLQVLRSSQLQTLAEEQATHTVAVPALRGSIYDRDGQLFALSVPTRQVVADDFQIAHPITEAEALAPMLGVSAATLIPELSQRNGYVVLDSSISTQRAAALSALSLPGISLLASSVRTDPLGSLAVPVVGITNSSGDGISGLEWQYDALLAGRSGTEQVLESPDGVDLPARSVVLDRPVPGTSLELTLDAPLQYVTEEDLARALVSSNGLSGEAVVMDTRTGQILSMASLVNLNQRDPQFVTPSSWPLSAGVPGVRETQENLALTQVYEPGSVFKIVPFSGALLAHRITPQSAFDIPDYVMIDGHTFHDAEQHGLERLTATQILEYSSNIGTYEISRRLGEAGLLAAVDRLGFGQPTGLGFLGESTGLLTTPSTFSATSMASLPIGQEDAVTAMQVLDAYNAIANGGVFVHPSLVRAELSADGAITRVEPKAPHRVLPASIASELTGMLERVVAGGTGVLAQIPGYTVAGKTGTAQIPTPGGDGYVTGAYNATFVGFAPAQNPVLSMIVVIQRPTPVIFGGDVAAPVFQKVMSYALHRYDVPATAGVGDEGTQSQSTDTQDVT